MQKNSALCFFIASFLSFGVMGQSKDSLPAKPLIEKGATGDLIIGKENKKKQLSKSPQFLQQTDSLHKMKKCKHKNCRKCQ